jgi:hypothetical protein
MHYPYEYYPNSKIFVSSGQTCQSSTVERALTQVSPRLKRGRRRVSARAVEWRCDGFVRRSTATTTTALSVGTLLLWHLSFGIRGAVAVE